MKVVVLYQSMKGSTKRAAELIGNAALKLGVEEASMRPVTNVDHHALAEADLVFVGTWVDGIIVAGHRPGQTGKLMQMPALHNKKVAAFMTYKYYPGKATDAFAGWLNRQKGADVVAAEAFQKNKFDEIAARAFVAAALEAAGAELVS